MTSESRRVSPERTNERAAVILGAMHPKTQGILESSLYVDDVARSARFYERIFGFRVISDFGWRGCAMEAAARQVLLLFLKNGSRATETPHHGDGELHVAFAIREEELTAWEDWQRLIINLELVEKTGVSDAQGNVRRRRRGYHVDMTERVRRFAGVDIRLDQSRPVRQLRAVERQTALKGTLHQLAAARALRCFTVQEPDIRTLRLCCDSFGKKRQRPASSRRLM